MRKLLMATAIFAGGLLPAEASEERSAVRIELQASMQRHIDRNMVDGAFLHIDLKSGVVEEYYPTKAHTVVLAGDGYYVLCADVKNKDGKVLPVDYYVAEAERGYRVFRTEVANRKELRKLMKQGLIRKF